MSISGWQVYSPPGNYYMRDSSRAGGWQRQGGLEQMSMPGHEQFGSLPMYPRPSYRNSYSPHFQPRSQPGCIRVRVGGMPDLDSQEEAYVLVGFGHQPVTASMLLPHEDSALLLHHQWQTRLFEYDDDPAAHGSSSPVLSLEVMCWRPGSGEQSLGKTGIPARKYHDERRRAEDAQGASWSVGRADVASAAQTRRGRRDPCGERRAARLRRRPGASAREHLAR